MSLRELTDPSLELVHRVPALPQVDLAHSMQVMRLTAYANLEAETEIGRAYRKADLFRKAFGREIEIRREG